ncbi:acyl-CoA N-acyltransferase [Peziza echinospora]|nr:acyl-CoA N-acyltransferase [Peziza echinospora]
MESNELSSKPTRVDLSSSIFVKLPSKGALSPALLLSIKNAEKHTFPTSERFDFDSELLKRTTNLYCLYTKESGNKPNPILLGYIVFLRTKALTRIHKVCVVESMRGQGIGTYMVTKVLKELKKGGAGQVDLWVDEARVPARALYKNCGFVEKETVLDYYGKGRNGIRMKFEFSESP